MYNMLPPFTVQHLPQITQYQTPLTWDHLPPKIKIVSYPDPMDLYSTLSFQLQSMASFFLHGSSSKDFLLRIRQLPKTKNKSNRELFLELRKLPLAAVCHEYAPLAGFPQGCSVPVAHLLTFELLFTTQISISTSSSSLIISNSMEMQICLWVSLPNCTDTSLSNSWLSIFIIDVLAPSDQFTTQVHHFAPHNNCSMIKPWSGSSETSSAPGNGGNGVVFGSMLLEELENMVE